MPRSCSQTRDIIPRMSIEWSGAKLSAANLRNREASYGSAHGRDKTEWSGRKCQPPGTDCSRTRARVSSLLRTRLSRGQWDQPGRTCLSLSRGRRAATFNRVIIPDSACSKMWQCIIHRPGSRGTSPTSIASPGRRRAVSRQARSSMGNPFRDRTRKKVPCRCIGCNLEHSFTRCSFTKRPRSGVYSLEAPWSCSSVVFVGLLVSHHPVVDRPFDPVGPTLPCIETEDVTR